MIKINSDMIKEFDKQHRINLINSLIGYRSLNLLGTVNKDNICNLCVISSTFHLGASPPLLGFVIRPQREHNDSLRNIITTKQFSLNNVLPEWYMWAHQTSASYPSGISEFETCGFSKEYVDGFKAPFVKQSTISIGLELRELIEMKLNGTTIVIGEVVEILTDAKLITADGTVDHIKAETMTVAGLDTYFIPQLAGQLAYAKPGVEPHLLNENQI
ncbi:flavin reductase family protein [Pedobacter mendelii]|uniref:Flavin oxidoreductase n=1 Tax=Pedobacter mendelii TaxID=1908240 RepID=A0ABQ2BGK9_9SPHI|nr:flavin reductase [Pedobacter mendelii]GGI23681.1 flavin oxidoreductase [Pedobacter mendelii]